MYVSKTTSVISFLRRAHESLSKVKHQNKSVIQKVLYLPSGFGSWDFVGDIQQQKYTKQTAISNLCMSKK